MPGLIAEKIGMTQIFSDKRMWLPVTVLKAGPCTVIQKKTKEKEGYGAVQVGFGEVKKEKRPKAYSGHCDKKGLKVAKVLREFRTELPDSYNQGDTLTVENFKEGDLINVSGISKGKGFQGVMKRHHFAGGHKTHGCSVSHRAPGSVGQRTYPGKIWKNKKMAGRMGGENVTTTKLTVVGVELEQNLLLVKGAIPGPNHGLVLIRSVGGEFEKRFKEKKTA